MAQTAAPTETHESFVDHLGKGTEQIIAFVFNTFKDLHTLLLQVSNLSQNCKICNLNTVETPLKKTE